MSTPTDQAALVTIPIREAKVRGVFKPCPSSMNSPSPIRWTSSSLLLLSAMANPSSLPKGSFLTKWQLGAPIGVSPDATDGTISHPVTLKSNGNLSDCTIWDQSARSLFKVTTGDLKTMITSSDGSAIATVQHGCPATITVLGYSFSQHTVDLLIPIPGPLGYDLIFPHHEFLHLTGGQQQEIPDEL